MQKEVQGKRRTYGSMACRFSPGEPEDFFVGSLENIDESAGLSYKRGSVGFLVQEIGMARRIDIIQKRFYRSAGLAAERHNAHEVEVPSSKGKEKRN